MLKDYKKMKLEKGGVYLFLVKSDCSNKAVLKYLCKFFHDKGIQIIFFVVPNIENVKVVDFSNKNFKEAVLDIVAESIKSNGKIRSYIKKI